MFSLILFECYLEAGCYVPVPGESTWLPLQRTNSALLALEPEFPLGVGLHKHFFMFGRQIKMRRTRRPLLVRRLLIGTVHGVDHPVRSHHVHAMAVTTAGSQPSPLVVIQILFLK